MSVQNVAIKSEVSSAVSIDTFVRNLVVSVTIAVGFCAGVLSYAGLYSLAVQAGIPPFMAVLVPLCIDGLVVVGALSVLHATLTHSSTVFGWTMTLIGVALSVYGNAASVAGEGVSVWQDRAIHAIAPLSLALCVEALMLVMRKRASDVIEAESAEAKRQARLSRAPATKLTKSAARVPVDAQVLSDAKVMLAAGESYAKIAQAFPVRTRSGWYRLLNN